MTPSQKDVEALWNQELLDDAFSDIASTGSGVEFDGRVLTIRAPKFHIVMHQDLSKQAITMISDNKTFDGAAIDMVYFFRCIDAVAAKILSEIDGIDRGV
jgi:hypothetical protein